MPRRARNSLLAWALAAALAPLPVLAQPQEHERIPFVTLDEARLFAESRFGKVLQEEILRAQTALAAENREIEASLEKRERDLTEQRAALPAVEFRALADAFNAEVVAHREAQNAKERALYQHREAVQERFRQVSNQVLAQVLADRGALAVLSAEVIVLGFSNIDITTETVARIDELVGDGSALVQDPPAAPEPEPEAP